MPELFKAALIGAGGFARIHMTVLEALQDENLLRTIAVADPQIATIAAAANWKYRDGLRLYPGLRELLAEEKCDLVSIATPPFLHLNMVEAALAESSAFVYLEKPPVPLYTQLERLLENPRHERVTVGFQFLESKLVRDVKRRLVQGEIGDIRAIRTSSATPRDDAYYERSGWAGRLTFGNEPVFDGPASNGIAHLVHLVTYFGGASEEGFAIPDTVTGRFLRARPMESYDFAFLEGQLTNGAAYEIAVAHCSEEHHPWVVRIEGTKGEIVFRQRDMESADPTVLLSESYRGLLRVMSGESPRPTTRLCDCEGYLQAVCGGFAVSEGIGNFESGDIHEIGEGSKRLYSVPKVINLIRAIAEGEENRSARWFDLPSPARADLAARREDILRKKSGQPSQCRTISENAPDHG
jgi:predicted dehydrogenase